MKHPSITYSAPLSTQQRLKEVRQRAIEKGDKERCTAARATVQGFCRKNKPLKPDFQKMASAYVRRETMQMWGQEK